MRIVCPSCSAAYDVPEGLLIGRQSVRCARCGQEWQPTDLPAPDPAAVPSYQAPPPPERPAPPPPVVPAPVAPAAGPPLSLARRAAPAGPSMVAPMGALAIDRLMTPPPPPRPKLGLRVAWIVSILLVLALLLAAYVWRADVMAAWPPSERLYAALGLAGPAR